MLLMFLARNWNVTTKLAFLVLSHFRQVIHDWESFMRTLEQETSNNSVDSTETT